MIAKKETGQKFIKSPISVYSNNCIVAFWSFYSEH